MYGRTAYVIALVWRRAVKSVPVFHQAGVVKAQDQNHAQVLKLNITMQQKIYVCVVARRFAIVLWSNCLEYIYAWFRGALHLVIGSGVLWGGYAGIRRIPTSGVFLTEYTHLSDHK